MGNMILINLLIKKVITSISRGSKGKDNFGIRHNNDGFGNLTNDNQHSRYSKSFRRKQTNFRNFHGGKCSSCVSILWRIYIWYHSWCYKEEKYCNEKGGCAFFRSEYKNHLDQKIAPIIKPLLENKDICFESMYALDDNQRNTLKAHLYTYKEKKIEKTQLFTFYKLAVEAKKSFPVNRRTLLDEVRKIISELENATKSFPNVEIDLKLFEVYLGLPKPIHEISIEIPIKTDFVENLNLDISTADIGFVKSHEHTIKIAVNNVFAKSTSKETIEQIWDDMYPHIFRAKRIRDKIESAESTIKMCNEKIFHMLTDILATIDAGTPIVGICDGCKIFVPEDKEILVKRLNKYKKDQNISEECEWYDMNYLKYKDIH